MTVLITATNLYTDEANTEEGYDPDPPYHKRPLIYPRLAEYLLKHGAEVNAQDKWGRTALMLAVSCTEFKAVQLLLAHGTDINARDQYKRTVLMLAVEDESEDSVRFLLNHGADVTARDDKGYSALDRLKKINLDTLNKSRHLQSKRAITQQLKQHRAAS